VTPSKLSFCSSSIKAGRVRTNVGQVGDRRPTSVNRRRVKTTHYTHLTVLFLGCTFAHRTVSLCLAAHRSSPGCLYSGCTFACCTVSRDTSVLHSGCSFAYRTDLSLIIDYTSQVVAHGGSLRKSSSEFHAKFSGRSSSAYKSGCTGDV